MIDSLDIADARLIVDDCKHERTAPDDWYAWHSPDPEWRPRSGLKRMRLSRRYMDAFAVYYLDEKEARRSQAAAETEKLFSALAEQWRSDTVYVSSITKIVVHPAYQQIIGMGERVLPLILRRLQERHEPWFPALSAITRSDPVPIHAQGDVRQMTAAWIRWGNERGLL